MTTKSSTPTKTETRTTAPPNPENMTIASIVGEITFNNINKGRKKELHDEIFSRPINSSNISDWILAFKISSPTNPLASKITPMKKFICNLCCDKALLKEICQSDNLPKEIIEVACWKSKNFTIALLVTKF